MSNLRLVTGDAPPWHRQPNEDEGEFAYFGEWLMSHPRPTPPAPELALKHRWTERATAYDVALAMPKTPKDQASAMLSDAVALGANEIRKWLKESKGAQHTIISVKDAVMLINVATDNKEALARAIESGEADLSDLSEDELDSLLKAKEAVMKLGDRKRR